jgi:hypothetical protein
MDLERLKESSSWGRRVDTTFRYCSSPTRDRSRSARYLGASRIAQAVTFSSLDKICPEFLRIAFLGSWLQQTLRRARVLPILSAGLFSYFNQR